MNTIDIRELDKSKYLVLDIRYKFYNLLRPSDVQMRILEILGDEEPLPIWMSEEERTYVLPKDLALTITSLAENDENVEVNAMTLDEVIKEIDEDPWAVEDDYHVRELRKGVFRF